jgi:hypothetical protein
MFGQRIDILIIDLQNQGRNKKCISDNLMGVRHWR